MKKRHISFLITFSLIFILSGCSFETNGDANTKYSGINTTVNRSTEIALSTDGELNISRISRNTDTKMGSSGTWTIFVYMCGTDLESNYGQATTDLQEMIDGTVNPNIRYIIQTGGTNYWNNELIDPTKNQRFIIENQNITTIDEAEMANMGNASTLSDFLAWGTANYPAENMGLIFWNHGSGSINGVCFDELYDGDSLSLFEIENALATVYPDMTDSFEFIGFDACLMGTVETANLLAPHARYLYASQEIEPNNGWDYLSIGNYLSQYPTATGADLGKIVIDSYYNSCLADGWENEVTLSCIDLSKIDQLIYAFDEVAENMYLNSDNSLVLSQIVKGITSAENYGGNNKAEGYTNMVDLGSILDNLNGTVSGTEQALLALNNCVIYMKNGTNRPESHGLSIYYPLSIQGTMELGIFKDICINPYYMTFVDKMAYANDTNGVLAGYNDSNWLGDDSSYWDDSYTEELDDSYWSDYTYEDEDYNFDDSYSAINFSSQPGLNAEGIYTFSVTPDTIDYIDAVYCDVFWDLGDGQTAIELGLDDNVIADWYTGEFEDNFSGYWFALPDGQPLATYIVEQGYDYNIYTSPVMVNGIETNLRIRLDFLDNGDYVIQIIGTWDGIDPETGLSSREITRLEQGDVIIPEYYAYDLYTYEEELYVGYEYIFDNDPVIYEELLPVGDYYYSFQIDDIFGGSLYTDFEVFYVDEIGDIYFYEDY